MNTTRTNGAFEAAELALREGLRADLLPPEALARVRAAVHGEWRAQYGGAARRPRRALGFAAAAILAAAGIGAFVVSTGPGAMLGELARADDAGVAQLRILRSDRVLQAGAALRAGQSFEFRGDSLVTLAGGGNLRVAHGARVEIIDATTIRLTRGEIYVDVPPGARPALPLVVRTAAGEFRHVGTQFAVAVLDRGTRVRVREGRIQFRGADAQGTVDTGTEALIDSAGKLTRVPFATAGRDWSWVEGLSPAFDIEGRPLIEFLHWYSRESGRRLVLADEPTRRDTATIRMHGSIRGLTALEALTTVMAATTLQFELPRGEIRVSSARVPRPPTQ